MGVEFRNVDGLAEPPGYSHIAVASGARLVFTAGAVPLDGRGELVGPEDAEVQGYRGQLVEIEAIAVVADDQRP